MCMRVGVRAFVHRRLLERGRCGRPLPEKVSHMDVSVGGGG